MTRYLTAAIPLPRARSREPAATSSRTGWNGQGCTGLSPAPKPLLNLRCIALNDEWEPFMNHHIQRETARLYANVPIQPPSTRPHLVA
ncbi:MAG: hypothetical protein H6R24_1751 [Proteobacteria bacterium]|nr:hypothetical protein [Pseudomonadota bacterium]